MSISVQTPKGSSKLTLINEGELRGEHVGKLFLDRDDQLFVCYEDNYGDACLLKAGADGLFEADEINWPVLPAPEGYVVTIRS